MNGLSGSTEISKAVRDTMGKDGGEGRERGEGKRGGREGGRRERRGWERVNDKIERRELGGERGEGMLYKLTNAFLYVNTLIDFL